MSKKNKISNSKFFKLNKDEKYTRVPIKKNNKITKKDKTAVLKKNELLKKYFGIDYDENYININALKHKAEISRRKCNFKLSSIIWTHHAWNPWRGCHKISSACTNCYIERWLKDAFKEVTKTKEDTWMKPFLIKEPSLIFVCNFSDFFIEEADVWRKYAWEVIKKCPQHTFQILTKRPERIYKCLPDDWGKGYDNVWLGVTVENNKPKVLKRLDELRIIPAKLRFVSAEPICTEFNFTKEQVKGFDWFISGGESGGFNKKTRKPEYRKCNPKWLFLMAKKLQSFNKSVFVKQLGTYASKRCKLSSKHGEDINQFPKQLQIREMPDSRFEIRNNTY
jgi:protein gp37